MLSVVVISNHSQFAGDPFAVYQSLRRNLSKASSDGSFSATLKERLAANFNTSIAVLLSDPSFVSGNITSFNFHIVTDGSPSFPVTSSSSNGKDSTDWLLIGEVTAAASLVLILLMTVGYFCWRRERAKEMARKKRAKLFENLSDYHMYRTYEARDRGTGGGGVVVGGLEEMDRKNRLKQYGLHSPFESPVRGAGERDGEVLYGDAEVMLHLDMMTRAPFNPTLTESNENDH